MLEKILGEEKDWEAWQNASTLMKPKIAVATLQIQLLLLSIRFAM